MEAGLIETFLTSMAGAITQVIAATGYGGVVILMAIESACVPLPSEIILPFAGSLVPSGRFSLLGLATTGAIGCNLGSAVAYWVGASGGRPAVRRWGRFVLLTEEDLAWSERFFARFGSLTVLVCRLLPVLRTFIALPAGFARMTPLRFHFYTFVGSWLWCFGLSYVGARLGEAWDKDPALRTSLHRFDGVVVAAGIAATAFFVLHRLRRIRRGSA